MQCRQPRVCESRWVNYHTSKDTPEEEVSPNPVWVDGSNHMAGSTKMTSANSLLTLLELAGVASLIDETLFPSGTPTSVFIYLGSSETNLSFQQTCLRPLSLDKRILCNDSLNFPLPWTTQSRICILKIFQRIQLKSPAVHKELMVVNNVTKEESTTLGVGVRFWINHFRS